MRVHGNHLSKMFIRGLEQTYWCNLVASQNSKLIMGLHCSTQSLPLALYAQVITQKERGNDRERERGRERDREREREREREEL